MTDKYKTSLAVIEVLAEQYPKCFSIFERRRKPLKLGIREDIVAALDGAATVKEIGLALQIYCGNGAYLAATCKEGATRIDLSGNVVGSVTKDEADNARQRLEQQRTKQKRRRDAAAQAKVKAKVEAEAKARNSGRVSLADLRAAARARRVAAE